MDRRSPNRRSPGPSRPDPVDRVEDEDEEMPGPSDPEPEAVASPSVPSLIRRQEAPAPSAPSPIRPSVIARAGPARSVIARAGPGPIRRAPVGASSIRRAPAAASRRAPVDDPMAPGPSGIGLRYLEGQPSGYPYGDLYRGFTPPPAPESRRYLNSLNPFGPSNRASPYQQPDAFRTSPYDRPDAFRTSPYDRPGSSQPPQAPEREQQQRYSMTDMMAKMAASQSLAQRTSSYSNRFRPSPSKASQGSTSQQPSSSGCQGSSALSCSAQAQLENRPFSSGHQETTFFRNYQRGTLESEPNRPQIQRQAQSLHNSPANPDPAARRRRIVSSMNAEQSNRIMRVPAARPENQLTPTQVQGIRELRPSRRRRSRNNEDDDDDLPRRSRSRSPLSRQASGRTQGTADSLSPGNRSQEDGSPEIFEYEAPLDDDNNDDIDDELEEARQGSSKRSSPASGRSSRQLESPKRLSYSYKPDQPISYCNPDPRYMNRGLPSPSEPGPSTRFYPQYGLGPRPDYVSPPRKPSSSRRSSRSPNPALLTPSQRSRRQSSSSQQSPRRATPRSRQESPKVPSGHPDDATIARFNATNTHWRRASDSPVRLMCNLPWPADESPPPVPRDVPSTLLRTRPARLSIPAPSTRNPPPGYFYGRQESDRRYDGSTANRRLSPQPKSKPSDNGRRSDEDDGYSAESESEYEE